jgi:hypothetical protein
MKKLIMLIAFATATVAVQAGSDTTCCEKTSSCCADAPAAKQTKAQKAKTARSAAKTSSQRGKVKASVQSPKAFADAH